MSVLWRKFTSRRGHYRNVDSYCPEKYSRMIDQTKFEFI